MRRDYFTLTVEDTDPPASEMPQVSIEFDGPDVQLRDRLAAEDGQLAADEVDVAFRLHDDLEEDAQGSLALTNRVTGEYILELNTSADEILSFVDAAREYGNTTDDDDRFRIVIRSDDEHVITYDKSTFLVYDADGDILRQHSLIPSGVQL